MECDVAPMTVCHLLLERPWQFDKGAMHDERTNQNSFKWHNKNFVLRPMTPSQVIADNATTVARTQQAKASSEMSGERENHLHASESHKPNMSEKMKRVTHGVVLLATKSEMREVRANPSILHFVLLCKGDGKDTNDLTHVPPSMTSFRMSSLPDFLLYVGLSIASTSFPVPLFPIKRHTAPTPRIQRRLSGKCKTSSPGDMCVKV